MLHQPSPAFQNAQPTPPADDDKALIALCRRAARHLQADLAATDRLCDIQTVMEAWVHENQPTRPSFFADRRPVPEEGPRVLKRQLAKLSKKAPAAEREALLVRLAAAEAYAVAYKAENERIGFTRADRITSHLGGRAKTSAAEVAALPAQSLLGMAAKSALLFTWKKAGYTLWDAIGEALAYSIAEDARMLGTGGPLGGSSSPSPLARPPRSDATTPAHH